MTTQTFFLKDIRQENYRKGLSLEEENELDKYLEEMAHGPADGEMDIDWESQGRGYYIHHHILHDIKDERQRNIFLQKLREDIDAWLSEKPGHHMVEKIREMIL